MNYKKHGGSGLFFAALAHAIDPTLDLDLLERVVFCDLCRQGHTPENGFHVILGASIQCEAFRPSAHPTCATCGTSTWANGVEVGGKKICTICSASR